MKLIELREAMERRRDDCNGLIRKIDEDIKSMSENIKGQKTNKVFLEGQITVLSAIINTIEHNENGRVGRPPANEPNKISVEVSGVRGRIEGSKGKEADNASERWSKEDTETLIELKQSKMNSIEIAKVLGRSNSSVNSRYSNYLRGDLKP